ncbi:MAG: exosortase/archaeosortase family protein [Planctomycetota bacterium]|nr:exosortase/archaeosortase family protein [Planctomycetota bacterium]
MAKYRYPSDSKARPFLAAVDPLLFWVAVGAASLGAMAWAYGSIIYDLATELNRDENYSVGLLVPFVAVYLVWRERAALGACQLRPSWWAGIGLLLVAQAARFYGLVYLFESATRYALVLTIAGLVLMVTGWQVFRRLAWVLLFLFLMIPLPGRIHNMISSPLQSQATMGAVFLLELFGAAVHRAGNVLTVNGTEVAVAEACSGLRMLTAFVVVAATLAYLVNRPRWQKAVLLASSVPIAIACNLARLVITAALFGAGYSKAAETFFHDFAGLAMMPLAVFILAGELWLMKKLVIPDEESAPAPPNGRSRAVHQA